MHSAGVFNRLLPSHAGRKNVSLAQPFGELPGFFPCLGFGGVAIETAFAIGEFATMKAKPPAGVLRR